MNWTKYFHATSGRSTPTRTEWSSASLATVSIWSGTLKQDILQAGGTWPPDGTRITSGHSATHATSQTKEDSGDLVRLLIESTPGEQRRLWKKLCQERRIAPTPYKPPSSTTRKNLQRLKERRTFDGSGHLVRSAEEKREIKKLRAERKKVMAKHAKAKTHNEKQRLGTRIATLSGQLYDLTGNEIYNN